MMPKPDERSCLCVNITGRPLRTSGTHDPPTPRTDGLGFDPGFILIEEDGASFCAGDFGSNVFQGFHELQG